MNAQHIREYIVRPALLAVDMWSQEAEQLVMATAAHESQFIYVKQHGGGPALGIFQMEPATHDSIWADFLAYRHELCQSVLDAIDAQSIPGADRMVWDFRYATIMCRLRYRWVEEPLPNLHDVWAMARYYKRYYNTPKGKATEQQFVDHWTLTV